jgi:multiple sugar transport system ATP-binding protein
MLGLMDCLGRRPKELSGGERQRVALGRAIVRRPAVYLFDEPLSNLDAPMRVQMRTEISKLHKQLGATTIYVTHDQVEAMTLGDRIAVMKRGVVQQVGQPMSVYQRPTNLFVAGFIRWPQMNFFDAHVIQKDAGLFVEEQSDANGAIVGSRFSAKLEIDAAKLLKSHVGKKIVFGIRPEKMHVSEMAASNGSNIEAVVEVVEAVGAETFLYLARGNQSLAARMNGGKNPEIKEKLTLSFDMTEAQYFDPETGKAIV